MSNLSGPDNGAVILAGAMMISLTAAAVSGVFVRGKILGPQRLDEDESPGVLVPIAAMGLLIWAMSQIAFVSARSIWFERYHPGQTPPHKLSDAETVICEILASVTAFVTLVLLSAFWRRHGVRRLGVRLSNIPAGFWRGLMGIIILLPFILLVSSGSDQLWNALHWKHDDHELLQIFKKDTATWLRAMVVLSATVFVPMAEETFFRGHVQTILRYTMKKSWPAVLITAALFAGLHPWWSIPPIFLLAVGLGYVYERTGNLWACIFLHSMFNSTMLLLFYYTVISHPA